MPEPVPVREPAAKLTGLAQIRCSAADLATWRGQALARGLSLSGLIREAVAGTVPTRIRRRPPPVDPALARQLAAIGNNLNQLARWANRDKGAVSALPVIARLIELDRELAAIRRAVERHAD